MLRLAYKTAALRKCTHFFYFSKQGTGIKFIIIDKQKNVIKKWRIKNKLQTAINELHGQLISHFFSCITMHRPASHIKSSAAALFHKAIKTQLLSSNNFKKSRNLENHRSGKTINGKTLVKTSNFAHSIMHALHNQYHQGTLLFCITLAYPNTYESHNHKLRPSTM